MRYWIWPLLGQLALCFELGNFQADGGLAIDMTTLAKQLIASLDYDKGITAANYTLGITENTSFHLFVTNRTEACHFHTGDTVSTILHGEGIFYHTNGKPTPQSTGSVYFIPRGAPHAFGHRGHPTVVTVAWSPPYHSNYTIPTKGCIGLKPKNTKQPANSHDN